MKQVKKKLGFFECLCIKFNGYRDGRKRLPIIDESNQLRSPYLDKEIHTYDKFSSQLWSTLQTELESSYARLKELADSIIVTKAELDRGRKALQSAVIATKTSVVIRKNGESKLTAEQVSSRRARETAKKLEPLKARLDELQNELINKIEEIIQLVSVITEKNNSTKMACNTMKQHFLQRIDIYLNSAMREHAETMSPTPSIELASNAESVYIEPHKELFKAEELLKQMLTEKGEENG